MLSDLISWQIALTFFLTLAGIIVSAFIYEHIRNPKILWIALFCLVGLEVCVTHLFISLLEQSNHAAVLRDAESRPLSPSTETDPPPGQPAATELAPTSTVRKSIDDQLIAVRAATKLFDRWTVLRGNFDKWPDQSKFPFESTVDMNNQFLLAREALKTIAPIAESYGIDAEELNRFCHNLEAPPIAGRDKIRDVLTKLEGAILRSQREV